MMSKSIASGLAALVLVAGVARAQDAPPADLNAHVKVGQRYTFSWTLGENIHEEVWHVAEVSAERVTYVLTTRLRQGGKTLVEQVNPDVQAWTWGNRPVLEPMALQMGKMKQARKTHEAPGVKLECVVTTLDGGLETWTAVKGDLEAFPGVVRLTAKEGTMRTLVRCEEGPAPTLPERRDPQEAVEAGSNLPRGALDHVKVGQRWVFKVDNSDMVAEQVWTVTEVHADEGRVVYKTKTIVTVDGKPITTEDEETSEWTAGGMPVMDPNTKVEGMTGERKKLAVTGLELDCYVLTTNMADVRTEVWTAVKGDHEVFPGPVKQLVGRLGQYLVRVEQP